MKIAKFIKMMQKEIAQKWVGRVWKVLRHLARVFCTLREAPTGHMGQQKYFSEFLYNSLYINIYSL